MATDNDLSASLPDPPPPRPDRRDAAIEAAMRRFDGAADPPRAADRPRAARPVPWRIGRPHIGALVTAVLVAAIGLPVWMATSDRFATTERETPGPATPGPVAGQPSLPQPATTVRASAVAKTEAPSSTALNLNCMNTSGVGKRFDDDRLAAAFSSAPAARVPARPRARRVRARRGPVARGFRRSSLRRAVSLPGPASRANAARA